MRILLIENDVGLLGMLARRLEADGYIVQAETEVPVVVDCDVVVMDLHLDTGLATTELGQLVNAGKVVVVFSGMNGPDERRARAMGIHAWVSKPDIDRLFTVLAVLAANRA